MNTKKVDEGHLHVNSFGSEIIIQVRLSPIAHFNFYYKIENFIIELSYTIMLLYFRMKNRTMNQRKQLLYI